MRSGNGMKCLGRLGRSSDTFPVTGGCRHFTISYSWSVGLALGVGTSLYLHRVMTSIGSVIGTNFTRYYVLPFYVRFTVGTDHSWLLIVCSGWEMSIDLTNVDPEGKAYCG